MVVRPYAGVERSPHSRRRGRVAFKPFALHMYTLWIQWNVNFDVNYPMLSEIKPSRRIPRNSEHLPIAGPFFFENEDNRRFPSFVFSQTFHYVVVFERVRKRLILIIIDRYLLYVYWCHVAIKYDRRYAHAKRSLSFSPTICIDSR